jgi:hypothetical protein
MNKKRLHYSRNGGLLQKRTGGNLISENTQKKTMEKVKHKDASSPNTKSNKYKASQMFSFSNKEQ